MAEARLGGAGVSGSGAALVREAGLAGRLLPGDLRLTRAIARAIGRDEKSTISWQVFHHRHQEDS